MVLVAVTTGLRSHLVVGAAQGVPVPGPPVVGDCVLDPLPGLQPRTPVSQGGTVPNYPAQQIRPCSRTRYGEITSVIATPRRTVVGGTTDNRYLEDPNLDSCYSSAQRYLGVSATPVYRFWTAAVLSTFSLSKPSIRQQAAGQRWAACIVAPPTNHCPIGCSRRPALRQLGPGRAAHRPGTRPTRHLHRHPCRLEQRFQHRLRAAARPGTAGLRRQRRPAGNPHPARGDVSTSGPPAHRDTRPHRRWRPIQSIQTHAEDASATPITTAQIPPHSYLACGVATTGSRKLRGSLLALGRRPIPWA